MVGLTPGDGEGLRECASCFIEIDGTPVVRDGEAYCCVGCADGVSCTCTYGNSAPEAAVDESSAESPREVHDEVLAASGTRRGATPGGTATGVRDHAAGSLTGAELAMRDALADATAILQEALGKMGGGSGANLLRTIEGLKTPTYQVNVSNLRDAVQYMVQLQKLSGVRGVAIVAVEASTARLTVVTESLDTLISGTTSMTGRYRPRTWRMSGTTIDIELDDSASGRTDDAPLFRLGADAFFGARHFVTMDGKKGPAHHHSWRVEVVVESRTQTSEGMVVGFAEARRLLERLVEPYNQTLLNSIAPFTEQQPTAENVARHLYSEFKKQFNVDSARLQLLRVWENPTNHATYSEDE